jgi:radical SAM protein with 4Fe4S-binding SPASM domain
MDFQTLKKIINAVNDEGLAGPGTALFLHGFGEPTINPHLGKFIQYSAEKNCFSEIQFVSNLLARPVQDYHEFFDAGLTKLYISFDSLDFDYIKRTRVCTDPDVFFSTFDALAENFSDKMVANSVMTDENVEQFSDLLEYLVTRSILQWNIQLLNRYGEKFSLPQKDLDKAFDQTRSNKITVNLEGFPYPKCLQPHAFLVFNVQGDIVPCCTDFSGTYATYGNIHSNTIAECLTSSAAESFISSFDDRSNPFCLQCAYY